MRESINEVEFNRLKELFSGFGWQTYGGGRSGTIDICKKVPELNDVVWMEIDVERLEQGEKIDVLLSESIEDFRAVWGACRVAISKETSIKEIVESEAIIRLYQYVNKMIDLKHEMIEILKQVRKAQINLV